MGIPRKAFAFLASAGLVAAFAGSAAAQSYPSRNVTAIIPFAAGNANDITARIVFEQLQKQLGQPIVIESKPGAGGTIGVGQAARATPDGYTVLFHSATFSASYVTHKSLPYDTLNDFTAVSAVSISPSVLVASPKKGYKTAAELIAAAKAKPGELNFASSGNGTSIHLSGELFKAMTGTDIVHVPYKGSGPAVTDLLGGQVQMMFDNMPSSLPHVKAGKLRALGVTSAKRSPALPEVSTIAEAGVPGYDATSWFGILAPAGTPEPVVTRLQGAIVQALGEPEMRQRMADLGAEPVGDTPAEFGQFITAELAKWAKVVNDAGVKLE
jgi:tripartite-type tricarboxylate transporter receptor subunit TctC